MIFHDNTTESTINTIAWNEQKEQYKTRTRNRCGYPIKIHFPNAEDSRTILSGTQTTAPSPQRVSLNQYLFTAQKTETERVSESERKSVKQRRAHNARTKHKELYARYARAAAGCSLGVRSALRAHPWWAHYRRARSFLMEPATSSVYSSRGRITGV